MHRRQLLSFAGTALVMAPLVSRLVRAGGASTMVDKRFPVRKTDQEWRAVLTPEQHRVLREHGTERAGTSPLDGETREGIFVCAGCGQALFASDTKYESGTGWPSFWKPIDRTVGTSIDRSWFMVRTEVHCSRCGGHLGHVFEDGPAPTGRRYCMNGVAMRFMPKDG